MVDEKWLGENEEYKEEWDKEKLDKKTALTYLPRDRS